jgi:hypothetical protein
MQFWRLTQTHETLFFAAWFYFVCMAGLDGAMRNIHSLWSGIAIQVATFALWSVQQQSIKHAGRSTCVMLSYLSRRLV